MLSVSGSPSHVSISPWEYGGGTAIAVGMDEPWREFDDWVRRQTAKRREGGSE